MKEDDHCEPEAPQGYNFDRTFKPVTHSHEEATLFSVMAGDIMVAHSWIMNILEPFPRRDCNRQTSNCLALQASPILFFK